MFSLETTERKLFESAVGTRDLIDIIMSSMATSGGGGVPQECKGQKLMAVMRLMTCKHNSDMVVTTWWFEGPYGNGG